MKLKSTQTIILACISLSLAMQPVASYAAGTGDDDPKEKNEVKKTKVSASRNNSSVKIYPDIFKRVMHVVAKDSDQPIDFFVFDLEGTLLKHYRMNGGDHQKIDDLARGKYVFSVFAGDEETASGNIDIR
jgi:hypothetical protein